MGLLGEENTDLVNITLYIPRQILTSGPERQLMLGGKLTDMVTQYNKFYSGNASFLLLLP